MEEIWKDIKGYEGLYQVSNYGFVKRLSRPTRISEKQYEVSDSQISEIKNGNQWSHIK